MSTTTSPTQEEHDHISPDRAFERLVWHNDRVCNGCFEHVREIHEFSPRKSLDVEDRHRTPQATLGQGSVIKDDYGELESGQPMTTCRTCARVGCWAGDDTLSKIQAMRLTTPLGDRLEGAGVELDRYTLREFVRIAKGLDNVAGYDTEIFKCAVKMAIRRA